MAAAPRPRFDDALQEEIATRYIQGLIAPDLVRAYPKKLTLAEAQARLLQAEADCPNVYRRRSDMRQLLLWLMLQRGGTTSERLAILAAMRAEDRQMMGGGKSSGARIPDPPAREPELDRVLDHLADNPAEPPPLSEFDPEMRALIEKATYLRRED